MIIEFHSVHHEAISEVCWYISLGSAPLVRYTVDHTNSGQMVFRQHKEAFVSLADYQVYTENENEKIDIRSMYTPSRRAQSVRFTVNGRYHVHMVFCRRNYFYLISRPEWLEGE